MLCMELSKLEVMPEQTDRARIRLLLLDDHLLFRESLAQLLASQQDFELVAECTTPAEALKSLKRSGVDVILVDIGIAEDFIPWAKKCRYPGKSLVIARQADPTGSSQRAEIRRLRHFSGIGFLKPVVAGYTAGSERGSLGRSEGVATPGRALLTLSSTRLGQSH